VLSNCYTINIKQQYDEREVNKQQQQQQEEEVSKQQYDER
jgi:hypothetical protein